MMPFEQELARDNSPDGSEVDASVPTGAVPPGSGRMLGSHMAWGQFSRFLEVGLSLAFTVLVVRALGPEDYATYTVIWSIVGTALLVSSFGLNDITSRFFPELKIANPRAAGNLVARLLRDRVLLSLVAAVLVWFLIRPLSNLTRTPALVVFAGLSVSVIIAQGIWEFLQNYFNASLRLRAQTLIRFIGQAISLTLALALFWVYGIQVWIPLVSGLINLVFGILIYLWVARKEIFQPLTTRTPAKVYKYGAYVWITNLATFGLATQIDTLLIASLLIDKTQISFYNVAVLLLSRLYTALTGWSIVIIPTASEAKARGDQDALARNYTIYQKIYLVILVPAYLFMIGWSSALITTIFDQSYAPAAPLLAMVTLFSLVSAIFGAGICNSLLYVADQQRLLLIFRIIAGVLNIGLDLLFIPRMGAAGAVLGTGIANLATHTAEFFFLKRITRLTYPSLTAFKMLGASLLAALPGFFIPQTGWISFGIGVMTFGVIFLGATSLIRPLSVEDYEILARRLPLFVPLFRLFTARPTDDA